jgi:hypothetical protein
MKSSRRRVPDELSDWPAFGLLKLPKKERRQELRAFLGASTKLLLFFILGR